MQIKRNERPDGDADVLNPSCRIIKRRARPGSRLAQRARHRLALWRQMRGQLVESIDHESGGTFRCYDYGDDVPQHAHG